jgi:hypothetical protein
MLDAILKQLHQFLETKRMAFPTSSGPRAWGMGDGDLVQSFLHNV